jgi:hypothetical protein
MSDQRKEYEYIIERIRDGQWAVKRKRTGAIVRVFYTAKELMEWLEEHQETEE